MRILSDLNNKGGVAKTSSAANLGSYMSYLDHKVLLVDTDPQANLTQHFNFYNVDYSLADAYRDFEANGDTKLPLLQITENLFIVPSSRDLNRVEREMTAYNNNQERLALLLEPLKEHFDICIIDCPPSLGLLTDNAVVASDSVIIPIEAAQFSLNGVEGIVEYLDRLKRTKRGLNFEIAGVFMTRFDIREGISFAVQNEIKKYFKDLMFETVIRVNTDIKKAQANGENIFVYAKNSNSALDYAQLGNELLARLFKNEKVLA